MGSEIPADILCEIFHLLCNEPIALHDLKNDRHFHQFPWAVGQVNRHWQGVFQSYPPLWTSFSLRPGTFSGSCFAEMNRRTAIYLECSGQQPLTIDVSMKCSRIERFPKTVWRMLLSLRKRWKKVNLVLGVGGVLDETIGYGGYMPILESLDMFVPENAFVKHYNAFQAAPHLTELSLTHRGRAAKWQFPWAQLTKLRIDTFSSEFVSSNDLWGVLFKLQNVEELRIITGFNRSPDFSTRRARCLPRLRFLEITLAFAMMLSWFTAPLLEHLHIRGRSDNGIIFGSGYQQYERELTSLIRRSSCHIRQLTLQNCGALESRMIMKALTSVNDLFIICPPTVQVAIQDITGVDDCVYLPKLQILRVKSRGLPGSITGNVVKAFSDFLETRGKGLPLSTRALQKFVVWFNLHEKAPESVLETMRSWPSFAKVYVNDLALEQLSTPPI